MKTLEDMIQELKFSTLVVYDPPVTLTEDDVVRLVKWLEEYKKLKFLNDASKKINQSRWIDVIDEDGEKFYCCARCKGQWVKMKTKFCPECGGYMNLKEGVHSYDD